MKQQSISLPGTTPAFEVKNGGRGKSSGDTDPPNEGEKCCADRVPVMKLKRTETKLALVDGAVAWAGL
jgi:hypothetical protein